MYTNSPLLHNLGHRVEVIIFAAVWHQDFSHFSDIGIGVPKASYLARRSILRSCQISAVRTEPSRSRYPGEFDGEREILREPGKKTREINSSRERGRPRRRTRMVESRLLWRKRTRVSERTNERTGSKLPETYQRSRDKVRLVSFTGCAGDFMARMTLALRAVGAPGVFRREFYVSRRLYSFYGRPAISDRDSGI